MEDTSEDIWLPQWPQGSKPNFRYHKPTFETHVGKSGKTWLIPAVTRIPNRGDHIYVTSYEDVTKKGTGFGGATLRFPLITGGEFVLNGGWHGNSRHLHEDTGIDTFNQHLTYGAVGLHRFTNTWLMGIFGILHEDEKPQIGKFNRIELLAQDIANERNEPVWYGSLSYGGGSAGRKEVNGNP